MSDADTPENLGFDFAPAWARKSADEYVSRYQSKSYDERTGREERPRREGDFRDRPPRRDRDGEGRPPRRPRHEGVEGERRPRREGAEGERPRTPRREGGNRPFVRREPVKPLDAEIRILPNQKNLGVIIKTLQSTHVAFPVKKFVNLFLENPQACLVRFEAKQGTDVLFWSCKACGLVALSEAEIAQHILANHLNDWFDVAEEPCDPPSGTFTRVAKCTLTGEWVGAPNHHSYRHRVAELAARAGMPEQDYLRTLEMHTDPESIEAWKQSVTTQTVYRLKQGAKPADEKPAVPAAEGEGDAPAEDKPAEETPAETRPAYNRDQAEAIFRRDILPTLTAKATHICLPVSLAQTSPSLPLRLLLKYTLRDEQRYPRSLFFALRGAFRHRKFTLFRGNDARGPEFVANMTPSPFTAEHAVREIKAALDYVTAHPLCTRQELLVALKTELSDMDIAVVARQIAFLFQKGHIIEYYNGVLALPETNPKFRKLPEEMKREREAAGAEQPTAETEAKPEGNTPATEPATDTEPATTEASTTETAKTPAAEETETVPAPDAPEAPAEGTSVTAEQPAEPTAEGSAPEPEAKPEAEPQPEPTPAEVPTPEAEPTPEGAPHEAE